MFFLAGLMGMMALGSVALVSTGALDEDEEAVPASGSPHGVPLGPTSSGEMAQGTAPVISPAPAGMEEADGIETVSLFARMGLINMPGLDASDAEATPVPVAQAADVPVAPTMAAPTVATDDLWAEDHDEDAFEEDTRLFDDESADPEAEGHEDAEAPLHGDWAAGMPADAAQDDDADVLVVGAWMTNADAAELLDYDALEDQLVVIFDDSGEDEEPEVDMRASADDPAITEILLNGTVLTALPTEDAPDPDGLVLVGESVAATLGLG